jgi:hypothetical protein
VEVSLLSPFRCAASRIRPHFEVANEAGLFAVSFAMCRPAAPVLPIVTNEKFGTFSF